MLDYILIVLCVWNVLECFDLFLDFCLDLFLDLFLDFFLDFFRIVVEFFLECFDFFLEFCFDFFLDFFLSCIVVAAVLCSLLTVLACVAKGVNNIKVISIIVVKIKCFFKCVIKFCCNSFIISSPN